MPVNEPPDSTPWAETRDLQQRASAETRDGAPLGPGQARPGGLLDGRYQILDELGRGNIGVVFRAQDVVANRQVALKLLHAATLTPEQRKRFEREGELTASLRHPGIVSIHAMGEADGRPYLVYELVSQARTLRQAFSTCELTERVHRIRDTARALAHAHVRGIVHRDLKPENILVDEEDRVRIADFGLALARNVERLTRTGAALGTPLYMAPEQILGWRQELGPPTDVWALGVMLYEALSGRLPFEGDSFAHLGAQIMAAAPPPPSSESQEAISPALEAVCLKALSRDPRQRQPDAGAFAYELEQALADPTGRALQRGRAVTVLLGLGVALAIGVLAVVAWPESPAPADEQEPASSTVPEPESKPPPDPKREEARLALEEVRERPDPRERDRAVGKWLTRFGARGQDLTREAEALRRGCRPLRKLAMQCMRVRFLPSGRRMVWRGTNDQAHVWDLKTHQEVPLWRTVQGTRRSVEIFCWSMAVAHGRDLFVTCWREGRRVTWVDGETGREERVQAFDHVPRVVAITPDGKTLAVGMLEGDVRLLDATTGVERARFEAGGEVLALAFSPDGELLAVGTNKHQHRGRAYALWSLTDSPQRLWRLEVSMPTGLAFSQDGKYVLAADRLGALFLVTRAGERTELGTPDMIGRAHVGRLNDVVTAPDGRVWSVASLGRQGAGFAPDLVCWDPSRKQAVGRFLKDKTGYRSVAVSSDGTRLLLARDGQGTELWSTAAFGPQD